MTNNYSTKLSWALAIGLLAGAILGVTLVGGRVIAAMLDAWKFADTGSWHGIDLGARSSLQFLFLCLLGTAGCFGVIRFHPGPSGQFSTTVLLAGVLYVCAGAAIVALVSTGSAYLYCGR
jgi:hypothetical protein